MPAQADLNPIQRGDTVPYTFNFADNTNPIDMRGKTVVFMVKQVAIQQDEEAVLTKSVTPAADDSAAQGGTVVIQLEHSDTLLLKAPLTYAWSLRIQEPADPEPIETTYVQGSLAVGDS